MSKKIAFCINDLPLAGAENLIFRLFESMIISGDISKDSYLIVLKNTKIDRFFMDQIQKKQYNFFVFFNNHSFQNIFFINDILRIFIFFTRNKFDVFLVNLFPSLFVFPLLKIFRLINNSSLFFVEHSTKNNRPNITIYLLLERFFYKIYKKIICISDDVKKNLLKRIGEEFDDKICIINNGLPPYKLNVFSSIRNELNIPSHSKIILMTSRIGDGKDHLTLLKAFEQCFEKNLYLLLIGSGDFTNLLSFINSDIVKNNVKILGIRSDARDIMHQVDINVLSSAYEGLSGVTLEAFDAKKPFLGSNVPGIKELVGDPRCLFNYGDFNELATKIKLVLSDQSFAKNIVKSNFQNLSKYDFKRQICEYKKIFN